MRAMIANHLRLMPDKGIADVRRSEWLERHRKESSDHAGRSKAIADLISEGCD